MIKHEHRSPLHYEQVCRLIDAAPEGNGEYIPAMRAGLDGGRDRAPGKKSAECVVYRVLSEQIGGFLPGGFTVLCGATGTGKTTLLANIACDFLVQKLPFFVASVEIGHGNFAARMLSVLSGEEIPDYFETMEERLAYEANVLKHLSFNGGIFSPYDSRVDHRHLLTDIWMAHKEHGVKVALMDNLNYMMEVTSAENQVIAMDKVIHDMVVFAKRTGIHLLMVLHPKKTMNGRVETEFDVKGSSTAVQEAGLVLLWNRLENSEHAPQGENPSWCRELKLAKCRARGRNAGARIIYSMREGSELLFERGLISCPANSAPALPPKFPTMSERRLPREES